MEVHSYQTGLKTNYVLHTVREEKRLFRSVRMSNGQFIKLFKNNETGLSLDDKKLFTPIRPNVTIHRRLNCDPGLVNEAGASFIV